MNVCIFGASSSNIPECYIEFAEKLGHRLASDGHGIVFGAGRTGLMGAAARGAYSAGGKIIGVIPEKLNIPGIYFEHCTERIQTAAMHERKQLMESRSDAFVALSGGFGTLEELLEVLTLKQLGYHNLPVIIVNINGFYDPLIAQFERCVAEGFTDKHFLFRHLNRGGCRGSCPSAPRNAGQDSKCAFRFRKRCRAAAAESRCLMIRLSVCGFVNLMFCTGIIYD